MNIEGVGLDLVAVERIERMVDLWGEKFLNRIYTEKEIEYCLPKKRKYEHLAGRFAAKEAYIKAAGAKLSWKEIEVVSGEGGAPTLRLDRESGSLSDDTYLTITHEDSYALAMVLIAEPRFR